MDRYIEGHSTREIIEQAQAILAENIELNRTVNELRGRLKEARREARVTMDRAEAARRYKLSDSYRKQIILAACGLSVALTLLMVAVAMCWGWARA